MAVDKKQELIKMREQFVVKDNDLIQKTGYMLTANEQKVVLYAISKIQPDSDIKEITCPIQTFCDLLGIENNGKNYANFRNTIQKLADKSFWIREEDKNKLFRWFDKIVIADNGNVTLGINKELEPYLTFIQENYTMYRLEQVLVMKSKYSIRLYELLRSYLYVGEWLVSIERLKQMLQTAEYPVYNNFKVRVLDIAVNEINLYTDITVEYKPLRENRKIKYLAFKIHKNDTMKNLENEVNKYRVFDNEE